MVYLVADCRPHGTAGYRKPYWRVTGMFTCIMQARRWAGRDGIVTVWDDIAEADKVYQERALPDVYTLA